MTIKYHTDLIQGSDEWKEIRRGKLTASEMHLILTPTLKMAANDKERAHVWELAAQRISGYVEPSYIGDNQLRGWEDEIFARDLYSKKYHPVQEVGFVENDRWGFTIGYSPDGLVGDDGLLECKSRKQRIQVQTIATNSVDAEFVLQIQTGLLVSERPWLDHCSYSGGLPMLTIRVYPDPVIQAAILEAASAFEQRVAQRMIEYNSVLASGARLLPTERRIEMEMHL